MPGASSTKRQRLEESSTITKKASSHPSRIFSPFRSVGNVTNGIPFAVTNLGQNFVITTSVGNFFQIYDASSLHLLFVSSPRTPSPITSLHSHFHYVFAAWGNNTIGIFKRGKLETTLLLDSSITPDGPIKSICLFGEHLCAATDTTITVFKVNPKIPSQDPELYTSIKIPKSFGKIKEIIHPQTYLNKVAVIVDNSILLYNVRTGRLLFSSDATSSPITCIEPSPVLDIVAIGTASGEIQLYHLKQGRVVFSLDCGARVTSMSFRTDGTPILGVATAAGDILFYHLNSKKRIHILREAHKEENGGVSRIHFFNGQPIFATNGGDNKLSEYVFDPSVIKGNDAESKESIAAISAPRLLRSRGGHSLPPVSISFTDEEAHFILSASRDHSLWSFSLRKDAQSYEFSQKEKRVVNGKARAGIYGSYQEKFPEIIAMAYERNKQGRWDNILTAHKDLTYAHSWNGKKGIVGPYHLETSDGGFVKAVCISPCGNFGVVGSSLGGIDVYNLQSGILKRHFIGHTQAITGIAMDSLNTTLISSSLDGQLRFYDFQHKSGICKKITLPSSITSMVLHNGSDLVAVSLDNLSIVVIDAKTKKIVRELWGHTNSITSFDFSPDGRWIISASLDSTIRTWDLPTGGCIDAVKVDTVATCVKMSPNGDWLATTHVQGLGVNLWTNRSQFRKVSPRIITEEDEERDGIASISMPNANGEGGVNIIESAVTEETEDDKTVNELSGYTTVDQLSKELITLSMLPRSKFNTLTHLEAIKLRNKPKQAPKKPEKLPFFLGSAAGNNQAASGSDASELKRQQDSNKPVEEGTNRDTELARLQKENKVVFESEFTRLLNDESNIPAFIAHLKSLSPASTDLQIRSLNTYAPLTEFIRFINALTFALQQAKDYELVQAWMAMLLRVHGDVILAHSQIKKPKENNNGEEEEEEDEFTVYIPELVTALGKWDEEQRKASKRLEDLAKYCSGVIDFLKIA